MGANPLKLPHPSLTPSASHGPARHCQVVVTGAVGNYPTLRDFKVCFPPDLVECAIVLSFPWVPEADARRSQSADFISNVSPQTPSKVTSPTLKFGIR